MRLEKIYLNGEVLYREIPEQEEKETPASTAPSETLSFFKRALSGISGAFTGAIALGKRIEAGSCALGKRLGEKLRGILTHDKKLEIHDDGDLIRLLPHLDVEGRHEVYLKLRAAPNRLDAAQLGALLPYLSSEDFEALCEYYREKNG